MGDRDKNGDKFRNIKIWRSFFKNSQRIMHFSERERLSQEQRQELIETVNFTLLNEETLQGALAASVVPANYVAKGAIALCSRLRGDLETARATLQRQDDEIKRLKTAVKRGKSLGTPIMTSSTSSLRDTSFGSLNGGRDPELDRKYACTNTIQK